MSLLRRCRRRQQRDRRPPRTSSSRPHLEALSPFRECSSRCVDFTCISVRTQGAARVGRPNARSQLQAITGRSHRVAGSRIPRRIWRDDGASRPAEPTAARFDPSCCERSASTAKHSGRPRSVASSRKLGESGGPPAAARASLYLGYGSRVAEEYALVSLAMHAPSCNRNNRQLCWWWNSMTSPLHGSVLGRHRSDGM